MREEWSPWFEHDGSGCPVAGLWAQIVGEGPSGQSIFVEKVAVKTPAWDWTHFGEVDPADGMVWGRVLRYRLRRPPAVQLLVDIAETLPVRELEDA